MAHLSSVPPVFGVQHSSSSVFESRPSSAPRLVRHESSMGPGIRRAKTPNLSHALSDTETVGETLLEMRERMGLSKKDLAKQLGITIKTITRWERDELQIDRAAAMKLMLSREAGA